MKFRALLSISALLLSSASFAPAHGVGVPLLSCNWKGIAHIDSDWSWETVIMDLGPGTGRCTGIHAGPYVVAITQGYGASS